MNVNKLIKNTLAPVSLPVDEDVNRNGADEYITFLYTSEDYDNFSDGLPENDYTTLQLHYFTPNNPHEKKKQIAELLFVAGFDVSIGMTNYETDTKKYHVAFDIGIDGVADIAEREE